MKGIRASLVCVALACLAGVFGCQSTQEEVGTGSSGAILVSSDPAGKLALVKDGKSLAPIVVFKGAPPMIRAAADELAEYIEKITGTKPKVVEGAPDPLPEHAIWVGYQPVLKKLFPKVDFDFKKPEEILIAANENNLVICGRDKWDPKNLVVQGRNGTINGKQAEYGTVNAVYTFLQDCLGVRWLMPGEMGVDFVKMKTLAFEPFVYRYAPQIRARHELFRLSALADGRGHSHDWVKHQRLQLDSLNIPGGHAFDHWFKKYHDKKPEIFALQPSGERNGFPFDGKAKLCQSNPEVWDLWLKDVEEQVEKDPYQLVFNGSPNDSWNRGICVCEKCREWDNPDGPPVRFHWEGLSQEYVAMSDRYVTFANHLAKKLKERYPDKDFYVKIGAYGGASGTPPVKAVPADNVFLSGVHNFHLASDETREAEMKKFAGWSKVAKNLAWRPNMYNAAGFHAGLLDSAPHQVIEDMRFVAENNCRALFFDTIWEHWANKWPHFYMLGQMAWNPYANGEVILNDFYKRAFGPAEEEMKAYWTLVEDKRRELLDAKTNVYKEGPKYYDKSFFDEAYGLLDKAAKKVADQPKYLDRVKFVRVGLDYQRMMMDIRSMVMQMEESGEKDPKLCEKIDAAWEDVKKLCKDNPMAFNGSWISPKARYMKGFHYDRRL